MSRRRKLVLVSGAVLFSAIAALSALPLIAIFGREVQVPVDGEPKRNPHIHTQQAQDLCLSMDELHEMNAEQKILVEELEMRQGLSPRILEPHYNCVITSSGSNDNVRIPR